jgi:SAM-dependent methyltransferase
MSLSQLSPHESDLLRAKVNVAYSTIASAPHEKHPFPVGRKLAEDLGYPAEVLDGLPQISIEAFAGVSRVSLFAELLPGAIVLDLGCGAGMESIIAAERVGRAGRVIGVDFSKAMLARAQAAKEMLNLAQLEFYHADAEHLPLPSGAVDVALVNGIFNLNPQREQIFSELARVLRPGGRVYAAELILAHPLPESERSGESNWFA